MAKNQKVIKIFSNGSLIFDNVTIFLSKNYFVFYEKNLFNSPLYMKNKATNSNVVEIENLKYRKKYFN